MKKILITGCSGFLAHYLIDVLLQENDNQVYGLTEVPDFRSDRIKVFNIDIRERNKLVDVVIKVQPSIIFHLAAITNVGFSWKNRVSTYEVNFIGSANLMEAVADHCPGCRLVLMSSAELYGENKKERIDEETPVIVKNPYSLSKYAMELAANLYMMSNNPSENLDIIKLRSFNFTGPGQDKKFVTSDFSSQIAAIEKGRHEPKMKVGNLSAIRDFSDVRDTARYLHVIGQKGESGAIYNVCSGNAYSIQEILNRLLSLTEKEIKVESEKSKIRPTDIPRLVGDPSKIKKEFGLVPQYNIEQTLQDMLDYWRDRESNR